MKPFPKQNFAHSKPAMFPRFLFVRATSAADTFTAPAVSAPAVNVKHDDHFLFVAALTLFALHLQH
jgi:hypothetical protein